ncbi:hypothetical protein BD309DRAFT_967019 [Dichomitus squalens]|uniref:Uncharacterized protein n=1 Tax=Dichomitus squalens TaxID=114155 RepID=A0A4V2K8W4_9APHY|nr:hypothetical protein BD309DRAFT_967019 [Dichomitus squalens]TBU61528.1 hypothetical protein BD310DRAFT_920916 [Dichomitus squalens]
MTSESLEAQLTEGLLTKHPEFWFSDGSLILRAHSVLFRVHISQLSRKSAFFRDLFSLAQPECTAGSNAQYLEGCPVLDMYDFPEDVANLVKVIYDGPNFGSHDRRDFVTLSSILRLSSKYLIEETTREKALAHIRTAWPSTLKGWDLREDLARLHEAETGQPRGSRYPHPIAVINLAREIDADELLPAAFYELSRYSFAQIFEPAPGDPLEPPTPPEPSLSYTLSPADLQRLTLGKEAAQHAVTALIQDMEYASSEHTSHRRSRSSGQHAVATGILGTPQGGGGAAGISREVARSPRRAVCVTPAACRADLGELVELATQHYLFDRERGCADPLYVAEELGQLKSAEFADCVACAHALEAWAARERERLWRAIPEWFRLRR